MGDADEEHRVFSSFGSGILHGATGMLLQQVVDVLDTGDFAFANAINAFVEPPDRRTERDAGIADLPAQPRNYRRRAPRFFPARPLLAP